MSHQLNLNVFGPDSGLFEDDEDSRLGAKVDFLQSQSGGTEGYRLRRIILCNFWLYGLQEFEVAHGRLFLAGENASGKSSVLAAALPLALDGDLRPNRLDTFGGRDRRIDYYVLGGADSSTAYNYERRTTYIALEFEWCNPDQPPFAPDLRSHWLEGNEEEREQARWLTVGVSLAGNVNASERIRALRFLVTDGARFGHALHMVDSKGVALDHPGFKRLLGEHGTICDTVAEYQTFVARYLFGIQEVKEFQNIINMLLVLRKPNLGSELNFSRVHDYLKQSLRKIPDETTRRVTGTIERIDSIQSQVERLQDAWEAAIRLDNAAQKLALAGARRSALGFNRARSLEISALGQFTRYRNELATAQTEREAAQARLDELTTEEGQVNGQIAALEASEGMQVAERLALVREGAAQAAAQLERQAAQLAGTGAAVQAARQRQERGLAGWQKLYAEMTATLQSLQKDAAERAEWPLAAAQLEEAERQVRAFSLQSDQAPVVPSAIEALAASLSQERISRLEQLEELYRQRETHATQERAARERETEKLNEYDAARQRRDAAQEAVTHSREELAGQLRRLYREGRWLSELPEYSLAALVSAALRADLSEYRGLAEDFARQLERSGSRLQAEQARLLQDKGVLQRQKSDLETLYRQKQAETDLAPLRTERRQQARQRLQAAGVAAMPLYALIDFSAAAEGEQAGRIERMLEDAGLLDGLVIRDDQLEKALKILSEAGLSDCWLQPAAPGRTLAGVTLADWLTFDPQAVEGQEATGWQRAVENILKLLSGDQLLSAGKWQQGLLAGQVGPGPATGYIGTANRRRLRRQELDNLQNRLEAVGAELTAIERQLEQNSLGQQEFAQEQARLSEAGRAGEVGAAEAERNRLEAERERAEKTLTDAQSRAREVRQLLNALTARILQESSDLPPTASDLRRLRALREATSDLRNRCALLRQSLQGVGERWAEYRENLDSLEAARRNEVLAGQLQAESQARYTQAQAELDELERAMQSADLQDLIERLSRLRTRRKELPQARMDTAEERIRADERARNLAESLAQAQQSWQDAQQQRAAAQTVFGLRLAAYPTARLTEARLLAEKEDFREAALRLLLSGSNQALPDDEQLEGEYTRAFNHLNVEYNQERPTLAEYGPELNDEGRITFIVEERLEPPGLLSLLAQQIEVQKTLLGQEERSLFEDFLLQEMAEAIRYHIGQTEAWVQKINRLLRDLPMVGEHYALEWKPTEEGELLEGLGSHIARQHKLLRKPAQTLSTEEAQVLMDAFRREIEGLRLRQKEEPGLNFMDALVQIFDYREWFRFSVFITPAGGNRVRLTDRNAGSRSGAEQLFALYVPLFAALAALYDSVAAPGCPRLLALDEAFDKASVANTQRIMEFLVLQGFQWIMTGPQVSGVGSGIPASTEYQMMHEKGSLVATAVPFFWIAGQELTEPADQDATL